MDETDIETGNGHEWDRVIERKKQYREGLGRGNQRLKLN